MKHVGSKAKHAGVMKTIIGIIVATTVAVVSAFLWGFTSNDLFLTVSIVSAFTTSAAVYHGGR